MNEEVNQKNITCSNTYNNVDYVTIETLLGDAMTYEEYINSLNKRNLVSVERLQNNWNELKKWLESKGTSTKEENDALCYFYTYKKMQELQGDDKNDSSRDV